MKLISAMLVYVSVITTFAADKRQVFFSPNGGCTEAVVANLNTAKSNVFVQAYSFTSAPIATALVNASKRGVTVQVILDKSKRTEKYSSADFLRNTGIPTFIDAKHAIAHNKIIVIDATTVGTGSFNFTKAAESSNAETLRLRPLFCCVTESVLYSSNCERNFYEIHGFSIAISGTGWVCRPIRCRN